MDDVQKADPGLFEIHPGWVGPVCVAAGRCLGMATPLALPSGLLALFADGAELLLLDEECLPPGPLSDPDPEFALLGPDMADYYDRYEFDEFMPGAWPLALDGGGGFFCLDVREVVAGRAPNDGSAPVVWSHAGNLGWESDEVAAMGENLDTFLAATNATRCPTAGQQD